jgi:hypothetical protein
LQYLLHTSIAFMSVLVPAATPEAGVSALYFSLFRCLFGLLMIPQVFSLVPWIHELEHSTFVFHYPYLSFIEAYSHELIYALTAVAVAASSFLALGLLPRLSAFIFLLSFGYLFLIDMSFYNNHYYLWCLLAILFAVCDTQKSISVIDFWRGQRQKTIALSNYVAFGALISIVYLYGGLVKINPDWLQGYPMRLLTAARGWAYPDAMGYFMSYAGILFDVGIAFMLWRKPTAIYILLPYLGFHLSNYFIFNIGEFPIVMIAALLVFVPIAKYNTKDILAACKLSVGGWRKYFYIVFFAFQLLFPLRSLLVGGNVAWHRQGYFFSWRMMLNSQQASYFQLMVVLPDLDKHYWVQFDKLLTFRQFSDTYHEPYFIWLLAQKLKADAIKKYGQQTIFVYAKADVTLNQHPNKPLIDQTIDLTSVPYYFFSTNSFVTKF